MYYLEIALLVLAVIVIIRGYKKNHRNVMLSGIFLLLIAGWGKQAATDFTQGFQEAEQQYQQNAAKQTH